MTHTTATPCPAWCTRDHAGDAAMGFDLHECPTLQDPTIGTVAICVQRDSEKEIAYVDVNLARIDDEGCELDAARARKVAAAILAAADMLDGLWEAKS